MQVDPHSIDLAVLRLLRDGDARVAYDLLKHRWRDQGFRQRDLPLALHRLQVGAAVRFEGDPRSGMDVLLLPPGARKLVTSARSVEAVRRYLLDLWQRWVVTFRPAPASDPRSRRRKPDLIDPFPARRAAEPDEDKPWDIQQPYARNRRYDPSRGAIPQTSPPHSKARNRKGR